MCTTTYNAQVYLERGISHHLVVLSSCLALCRAPATALKCACGRGWPLIVRKGLHCRHHGSISSLFRETLQERVALSSFRPMAPQAGQAGAWGGLGFVLATEAESPPKKDDLGTCLVSDSSLAIPYYSRQHRMRAAQPLGVQGDAALERSGGAHVARMRCLTDAWMANNASWKNNLSGPLKHFRKGQSPQAISQSVAAKTRKEWKQTVHTVG